MPTPCPLEILKDPHQFAAWRRRVCLELSHDVDNFLHSVGEVSAGWDPRGPIYLRVAGSGFFSLLPDGRGGLNIWTGEAIVERDGTLKPPYTLSPASPQELSDLRVAVAHGEVDVLRLVRVGYPEFPVEYLHRGRGRFAPFLPAQAAPVEAGPTF